MQNIALDMSTRSYQLLFSNPEGSDDLDILPKDQYHLKVFFKTYLAHIVRRLLDEGPDEHRVDLLYVAPMPSTLHPPACVATYESSRCLQAPKQYVQYRSSSSTTPPTGTSAAREIVIQATKRKKTKCPECHMDSWQRHLSLCSFKSLMDATPS